MKSILAAVFCSFLFLNANAFGQSTNSKWEPLVIKGKQKIWYNTSQLDSIKGSKFEIWILQLHQPPLRFSEIPGKILRSQTLYAINLQSAKYGILKVKYFDQNNKEIYHFDYHNEKMPDKMKYNYPILDGSFLHKLIKKIYNVKDEDNIN